MASSDRARLRERRQASRGFTLVELMVALTGGLFLSIIVFALSRDTSRFYQQETRVANATLAGLSGFERLSNDIARAGHLVTPNINADPRVCNRPQAGWPTQLFQLRSLVIDPAAGTTLAGDTELEPAGISPMRVEIAGALDATEELPIRTIMPNAAGGWDVVLQVQMPAMARLAALDSAGEAGVNVTLATLQNMFMIDGAGRAVRIIDHEGLEQYGVVTGVTVTPQPTVSLAGTPGLIFRTNAPNSPLCGFRGFNTGATINVINFVRYDIRRMKGTGSAYDALFAAADDAVNPLETETGRAELVRVELAPNGDEIDSTREIVAEYAVDLQLAPLAATSLADPTIIPVAAAALSPAYVATQLVRAVHVRLTVRSREADRTAAVPAAAGDLYRIGLGPDGGTPFARARTFQADIPLRNQKAANW